MSRLRLALAQIDPTLGDLEGNAALIGRRIAEARRAGAQLILFPELAVSGYPPEDLLLRADFVQDCGRAVTGIAAGVEGIVVGLGAPHGDGALYNAFHLIAGGAVRATYRKVHLPNYGVFDERRYFAAGPGPGVVRLGEHLIGLTVCEDLWVPGDPFAGEARAGAALILNLSSSPYHRGKGAERERLFGQRCRESAVGLAFCNLVGGQDELVFDGQSFVLDGGGRTVARAAQFREQLLLCELDLDAPRRTGLRPPPGEAAHLLAELDEPPATLPFAGSRVAEALADPAEVYEALVLGTRDYARKTGFTEVLLGLSGGIDSALVACIAADSVGARNVTAVMLPSPYSSARSRAAAAELVRRLGVRAREISISELISAYRAALPGELEGIAAENVQARIRGTLLMALSNRYGGLLLSTGNKSELSVGYATLYGDMSGGFAVIKDVPKLLVYELCHWRNGALGQHIPAEILEAAPSAELAPGQLDTDTLPPYELLDPILEAYVERDMSVAEMVALGNDETLVRRVVELVDRAEYKRRQAPPGVKITPRAFGRDRRMPIANRYRGAGPR
ncbi:MAG: NAD+ synthase [Gaiellales bacterium]